MTNRIRTWYAQNRETVLDYAAVAGSIVVGSALVYAITKYTEAQRQELEQWIIEQNREGKTVFKLADGRYMSAAL